MKGENVDRAFDPTSIALLFDPTYQRISGVTRLGNHSFDVPVISHIYEDLWQGGWVEGVILPEYIDNVISLYPGRQYVANHELKARRSVAMYDSGDQGSGDAVVAALWVAERSGPTLVHCQAGLNRSALVAALVLRMKYGFSADDAIGLIREMRSPVCLCDKTFERYVREVRW